jgi:hypothetical protein
MENETIRWNAVITSLLQNGQRNDNRMLVQAYLALGDVNMTLGRTAEAEAAFYQAEYWVRSLNNVELQVACVQGLVRVALLKNDKQKAARLQERLMKLVQA